MQIEIPKKERAKSLYDAGQRTPIAISRGAGVSDRTARRYIKEFKEGGSHERKPYPRKMIKRTSKLERKVLKKARDRRQIW